MICPHCQREITEYSNFCYFCGSRQKDAPQQSAAVHRRLTRSVRDSKIAGVCGGLAEYLDADPTIVRLAYVLLTLFTGCFPGIATYIVAWLIVPKAFVPVPGPASPATTQPAQSH